PGEQVPRQFLRILAGDKRRPFSNGSGRLDLAKAITAPDNPLTARVLVNRVWMHHFGEPLVASPSDFGVRSTPPTHPELLDWLALEFLGEAAARSGARQGAPPTPGRSPTRGEGRNAAWTMKRLHKSMVMSAAYQQ